MLIDDFMGTYDAMEHHEIKINAPAEIVFEMLPKANLFDSAVIRALFFLRALPGRLLARKPSPPQIKLTLNDMLSRGFIMLGQDSPHELLVGTIERFWAAAAKAERLKDAGEFNRFNTPGYAKAVMGFSLMPQPNNVTKLITETRVLCLDERSRRRFRFYWFFIGPFSSLIRRLMLQSLKRQVELHPTINN